MPTKKYFIAVAQIMHESLQAKGDAATVAHICRELADLYARQNANFDRARFLAACGVKAKD